MIWKEIKNWAKENGFEISKIPKENRYVWNEKEYNDLDTLVTDLWNKMTNNKWLDYQKEYKLKKLENAHAQIKN
jgi:hypothetical protein